eukprot:1119163-Pleurochrysis_carterae.AAC.2
MDDPSPGRPGLTDKGGGLDAVPAERALDRVDGALRVGRLATRQPLRHLHAKSAAKRASDAQEKYSECGEKQIGRTAWWEKGGRGNRWLGRCSQEQFVMAVREDDTHKDGVDGRERRSRAGHIRFNSFIWQRHGWNSDT